MPPRKSLGLIMSVMSLGINDLALTILSRFSTFCNLRVRAKARFLSLNHSAGAAACGYRALQLRAARVEPVGRVDHVLNQAAQFVVGGAR